MDTNQTIPECHPLHRLFRGLTESTFMDELGIGDPSLVGYVSNLLAEFVRSHPSLRSRDRDGRQLHWILSMIAEAESAVDSRRRLECYRQIGDLALFWTGVFPELLGKGEGKGRTIPLISCQQQGKRSYYLASTLTGGGSHGAVLRRLSDQFELCAFGLSRVRREWEKLEAGGAAPPGAMGPLWN
jgi:hypothetical protein